MNYTCPLKKLHTPESFGDFRELVNRAAEKFSGRTAFRIRCDGGYRDITYAQFGRTYYSLCTRFIDDGLSGCRIAVSGKNCYGWVLCYLAASTVGVVVPIDCELSGKDIADFINAADCKAFCSDSFVSGKTITKSIKKYSLYEAETENRKIEEKAVDSAEIAENEMRVLIFTSGTTGSSKGVCLSQKNILSNIYSTSQMVEIRDTDRTMSVLPLHHTYECTLNCLMLLSRGACICYNDGLEKIARNINEYSPTLLVVVPALLAVLSKKIRRSVAKVCPVKYKPLYENYSLAEAIGKTPFLIRAVIRKKVRKSLGGKLKLFIVGAAELDPALVRDFASLGIRTLQGYGLTECSPLLAGNNDFFLNPDSTGCVIPGVTLTLLDVNEAGEGEIGARGDNIMLGYYEDSKATAEVMRDGWFHTGDLGRFGADGALYICGRIKNVIVTANGKNIYPEEIESRLTEHSEIAEALVLSARDRKGDVCVRAKIYPSMECLVEKLGHRPDTAEIESELMSAVKSVNAVLPEYKQIAVTDILDAPLERTTTRKIKRFGNNVI